MRAKAGSRDLAVRSVAYGLISKWIIKQFSMKTSLSVVLFLALASMLSSCEAIGTIFEAGVWTGVLIIALVVGLIIFIIAKAGRKK